jgi:peptidoglycan/LPS O-acetylase OafA/YrhL
MSGLPLTGNGFLGVDVFFVLSGYLITALLLDERERERSGTVSLRGFYAHRTRRIFPLYYAVLGLLAAYFLLTKESAQRTASLEELPANLLYVSNWLPSTTLTAITRSLSTEEQFYLVWPPLFAWLGKHAAWILMAFLALNQAVNFGLADHWLASTGVDFVSVNIANDVHTHHSRRAARLCNETPLARGD